MINRPYPQLVDRYLLWKKIWKYPAVRVAAELGVTEPMLVKICAAHKIPKPPSGHWKKVEAGTQNRPIELPELTPEEIELGSVHLPYDPRDERELAIDEIRTLVKARQPHLATVILDQSEIELHEVVRAWINGIKAMKRKEQKSPSRYGHTRRKPLRSKPTDLDMKRFRVVSTILKMGIMDSWDLDYASPEGEIKFVRYAKHSYTIRVRHKMRKRTDDDPKEPDWTHWPEDYRRDEWPTDEICFDIKWGDRSWREGPSLADAELETAIARIMAHLRLCYEYDLAFRYDRPSVHRSLTMQDWEAFRQSALDWEECQRLRNFVDAIEAAHFGVENITDLNVPKSVLLQAFRGMIQNMDPMQEFSRILKRMGP